MWRWSSCAFPFLPPTYLRVLLTLTRFPLGLGQRRKLDWKVLHRGYLGQHGLCRQRQAGDSRRDQCLSSSYRSRGYKCVLSKLTHKFFSCTLEGVTTLSGPGPVLLQLPPKVHDIILKENALDSTDTHPHHFVSLILTMKPTIPFFSDKTRPPSPGPSTTAPTEPDMHSTPTPSSRPLTRGNSTRYVNMLLALDGIPKMFNIMASFFTWLLLAGFLLFPGTFSSLGNLDEDGLNAAEAHILHAVKNAPL